jgi:hypothetical protein
MNDDSAGPVYTPPVCPVCQARFRGSAQCSRCGADLSALMLLAVHGYALRQAARQLLRQGDSGAALASAQEAQRLHATPQGNDLQWVCMAMANAPDRVS